MYKVFVCVCVCVCMEFEMDLETDEMILKFFRMDNMEILRQVEKQKKDALFAMEHWLAWSEENEKQKKGTLFAVERRLAWIAENTAFNSQISGMQPTLKHSFNPLNSLKSWFWAIL